MRRVNHVEKRRALVLKRLQGRTTIMNMGRVLCVRALRASYLRYVANMISSCECEPGSQWVSSGPTHPSTNRTRVDVAGAAQPPPGCRYLYVILLFWDLFATLDNLLRPVVGVVCVGGYGRLYLALWHLVPLLVPLPLSLLCWGLLSEFSWKYFALGDKHITKAEHCLGFVSSH